MILASVFISLSLASSEKKKNRYPSTCQGEVHVIDDAHEGMISDGSKEPDGRDSDYSQNAHCEWLIKGN